jgi:hypothetical protein
MCAWALLGFFQILLRGVTIFPRGAAGKYAYELTFKLFKVVYLFALECPVGKNIVYKYF